MLLGEILRYAFEQALDIEWEKWSDSPFCFNGIPKDHRTIAQVVIYYNYKEVYIYTKTHANSSILAELAKFGPYAVYPSTYTDKDDEEKYRVTPNTTEGVLIKGKWH